MQVEHVAHGSCMRHSNLITETHNIRSCMNGSPGNMQKNYWTYQEQYCCMLHTLPQGGTTYL